MLDNREIQALMDVLENMKDEHLAAQLLREFHQRSKNLGTLILNLDPNLDHDEWKKLCDQAQLELDETVEKIFSHQ